MAHRKIITAFALALVVAGGLAFRLWVAWQDITSLLVKCVPDDSFFVFRIARNVAEGQGLTFDGVVPSNSPRLLWQLLLALVCKFVPANDYLAAHIILTLGCVADAGTIIVLFLLVRQLRGDGATALLTAAAYAFLPYAVLQANNGLETALVVALLGLALLIYAKLCQDAAASRRRYFGLGVLCGVVILTRLDYVLLPALLIVDQLWRGGRGRALYLLGGVATIAVPWVLFSIFKFGELLPSSGYAVTYTYYTHFLVNHGFSLGGWLTRSWLYFYKGFRYYAFPFFAIRLALFGPIVFTLLAAVTVAIIAKADKTNREKMRLVLLPVVMVFILLFVHGFVLWYAREWHTGPSLFAIVLLGGSLFGALTGRLKTPTRGVLVIVAALLLVPIYIKIWQRSWRAEAYKPFINHYRVSIWARDNLPRDAVIGSFDGGIPGYFTHRRVVDLVGIENEKAFRAIRERRMAAYLDEEGIDYLHLLPVRTYPEYDWLWGENIRDKISEPLYAATEPGVQVDMRTATIHRVIRKPLAPGG
jgi:hypothetical protein